MSNVYVALLRGINVGGKNKVDMKLLKKSFEKVGMKSVITYINSGNIVFSSNYSAKKVREVLEKVILNDFKLNIKVLVRSFDEYKTVIKALPDKWTNDDKMKSDVLFLDGIDGSEVKKLVKVKIDNIKFVKGTVLWNIDRKYMTKTGLMELPKKDFYKKITIRNVNTTRKIFELMEKVNSS